MTGESAESGSPGDLAARAARVNALVSELRTARAEGRGTAAAVSVLTGISDERLDELGGFPPELPEARSAAPEQSPAQSPSQSWDDLLREAPGETGPDTWHVLVLERELPSPGEVAGGSDPDDAVWDWTVRHPPSCPSAAETGVDWLTDEPVVRTHWSCLTQEVLDCSGYDAQSWPQSPGEYRVRGAVEHWSATPDWGEEWDAVLEWESESASASESANASPAASATDSAGDESPVLPENQPSGSDVSS